MEQVLTVQEMKNTEKVLFQLPYKQCSKHKNRRVEYIYIDPKKQTFLCCGNCAIDLQTQQIKLINILDIVECEEQTIFQHWPFINSVNGDTDKQLRADLEAIMTNKQQSNDRQEKITTFFDQMSQKINRKIEDVKKNMLAKVDVMSELSTDVKNCYNKYSAKEELKEIVLNINQSLDEKNKKLKDFFEQKLKESKKCENELRTTIQKVRTSESTIDMKQPEEMSDFIIKYIEKIDFFQNKGETPSEAKLLNPVNQFKQSTNSQLIYKLVSNRFNKCPQSFLNSFEQKLNNLQNYFDGLTIDEKWKESIYKNDLEIIGDKFNTLELITNKFIKYSQKYEKSSLIRSGSSQLNSTGDFSTSFIESRDNLKVFLEMTENKFNYFTDEYKEAIGNEFQDISDYISILELPKEVYKNFKDNDLHHKVLNIEEHQFQEMNYILARFRVDLHDDEKRMIEEEIKKIQAVLNNPNQGLISDPLLSSFNQCIDNIPQITISLFNEFPTNQFPSSFDCNGLNKEQIDYFNQLAKVLKTNQKAFNLTSSSYFSQLLNCYDDKERLSKLLKNLPIFELLFANQNLYNQKIQMTFQHLSLGADKQAIRLKENDYKYQNIFIEKSSDSLIFSNANLDQTKNYIIRMKFSQQIGSKYIAFGIEDLKKLQNKIEVDQFFITNSNGQHGKQFPEFIKNIDQIEIRINFDKRKLQLTDFPAYQQIYTIEKAATPNPQSNYRFVIRFGTSIDNFGVDITECYQVDSYLADSYRSKF